MLYILLAILIFGVLIMTHELGHFLAAHSIANQQYSWFGMQKEHMEIMKAGGRKVIDACRKSRPWLT